MQKVVKSLEYKQHIGPQAAKVVKSSYWFRATIQGYAFTT
jgi:hypothetical protein